MRVLVIEDDADLAANIVDYLTARGHSADSLGRLSGAQELIKTNRPDVLVLDLMLPDGDGIDFAKRLRGSSAAETPLLMLTARDTEADKLHGFSAGADDYLVKPFSLAELEARLLALSRRGSGERLSSRLVVADLSLDKNTRQVWRGDQELSLPPAQFLLLTALMANSHRVVPRAELIAAVWQDDEPETDILKVYIHTLRRLLDDSREQPLIRTVRGVGYQLSAP